MEGTVLKIQKSKQREATEINRLYERQLSKTLGKKKRSRTTGKADKLSSLQIPQVRAKRRNSIMLDFKKFSKQTRIKDLMSKHPEFSIVKM